MIKHSLLAGGLILALLMNQPTVSAQDAASDKAAKTECQQGTCKKADCKATTCTAAKKKIACDIKAEIKTCAPLVKGQKELEFIFKSNTGTGRSDIPFMKWVKSAPGKTARKGNQITKRIVHQTPEGESLHVHTWTARDCDETCDSNATNASSDNKPHARIVKYVFGKDGGIDVDVTVDTEAGLGDAKSCCPLAGCAKCPLAGCASCPLAAVIRAHSHHGKLHPPHGFAQRVHGPAASLVVGKTVNKHFVSNACECGDDGQCCRHKCGADHSKLTAEMAKLRTENQLLKAHEHMRRKFAAENEQLQKELFDARVRNTELAAYHHVFEEREEILGEMAEMHAENAALAARAEYQEAITELVQESRQSRTQNNSSDLHRHVHALTGELEKIRVENESLKRRLAELTQMLHHEAHLRSGKVGEIPPIRK